MSAKELIIKPIASSNARAFIKRMHYSGKVVANSSLHFGVFWRGKLEGVMQYGSPMKKGNMIKLVEGTKWNGMLELNRMAFSERLPRNSESRAIAVSLRLIKKHYTHVKWIISFADGCQCGDGTIYRASGFSLIGIKKNNMLRIDPHTGETMQLMAAFHKCKAKEFKNWERLEGYQIKYIYFIDKKVKERLTVPIIPFSKISEVGAGMYKGEKITRRLTEEHQIPSDDGGASPTSALQTRGILSAG